MWNPFVSVIQFRKFLVTFWVLIVLCACGIFSSDFEPGGKPEVQFINPDAGVVIGAAVNIREPGPGLFQCGDRRLDGVNTADALKWVVNDLNQEIWSASSANVSFGLYIMDGCGRTRTAASQLIDFLPELQNNTKAHQKWPPFKLYIVDDIGLRKEADILKSLEDIKVSAIGTNINLNSPQVLAHEVLLFVQELRWDHLAVVHSNSKFSSAMLKEFTNSLKMFDLCVPWIVNVDDVDEIDFRGISKTDIPILSLLSSEEHPSLLKLIQGAAKPEKKFSIMFSDIVSREQLKMVPANNVQILSVVPFPEKEVAFENFHSKNSILKGMRTEDKLDLVWRTKIVRTIKQIGKKISETLLGAMLSNCNEVNRLCERLVGLHGNGRDMISQSLTDMDWADRHLLHELVEYKYQLPDEYVHFHKIMVHTGHKQLEVFDANISFPDLHCDDEESEPRLECRCLEVKSARSSSGRNIDRWGIKKQRPSKSSTEKSKTPPPNPEIQQVDQLLNKPMVFAQLNDSLNGTLACLTLLGGLLTLIIAQYFATFAALPNGGLTSGTSVIGYVILIGLFLLFSTNLSFLLTPLVSTCALRRVCSSFSYAVIFSGMLIKVWSSLRQVTNEKAKIWKPLTLLLYSGAFTSFQLLPSGLWLLLKPPATEYAMGKWNCYPFGDLDTHLIISMIYPILLLLITLVLAIQTCSKSNNDEARWILISSSLVAIIFSCWGVAIVTGVWQVHRTACTNLAVGTILLLCLYIPKIKLHSELKKSLKSHGNPLQIPADFNKEPSVFNTTSPHFPVVLGCNIVPPVMQDNILEANYGNQGYALEDGSETVSTPFDIDSSLIDLSHSDLEQEQYTFSTFLEDPQVKKLEQNDPLEDPTQVIPSALYPIEMFNNEPVAITSDHCQPGTNEFTPPHRATSQLYLCPQPEWVP